MYIIHVSVMWAQSQCYNLNLDFMSSIEGYSFNSGNILTLVKRKCAEHISMPVGGTSHGSNDFSSQQPKEWLDTLVFGISYRFQQYLSHEVTTGVIKG